jgi:hypothetical protein
MPHFTATIGLPECFYQVDVPDVAEAVYNCPEVDRFSCNPVGRLATIEYRDECALAEVLNHLERAGFPSTVVPG